MKTFLILAALFAATPAPALADPSVIRSSEKVSYNDLDLSKPSDVKKLKFRLKGAVSRVCGDPAFTALYLRAPILECQKHAMDAAVASIGAPQLMGQPSQLAAR